MKPYLPLTVLVFTGILLPACDDTAEPGKSESIPIDVNFEKETLSFFENDPGNTIVLRLDKPAADAGVVSLAVTSKQLSEFNFRPAVTDGTLMLTVNKGATAVTFEVLPVDNDRLDGEKQIDFRIASVTEGMQAGTRARLAAVWNDNDTPAKVSFREASSMIAENSGDGMAVALSLSHPAPQDGVIVLKLSSDNVVYGEHFTTTPKADNSTLRFDVVKGARELTFTILPVDNDRYQMERLLTLTITDVSGGVEKGGAISHTIRIADDELAGKPKGYTTAGVAWGDKKVLLYDEDGRISGTYWEQHTPDKATGTDTYHYDDAGALVEVTSSLGTSEKYIREGGKVVRSEAYKNGSMRRYTHYGYDAAGNIGEAMVYYAQKEGGFALSLVFVYLYHSDGNLYKELSYAPADDPEDLVLLTTDTYDHYLDVPNAFGLAIIPTQSIQKKLPASFIHVTTDVTLNYTFSYEFLPDGRPSKRSIQGPGTAESSTYEYY